MRIANLSKFNNILKRIFKIFKLSLNDERRNYSLENKYNITIEQSVKININVEYIGEYSFIGMRTVVGPNTRSIGKFCSISQDCLIGPNIHPIDRFTTSSKAFAYPQAVPPSERKLIYQTRKRNFNINPVHIGNDVWIGAKSIILPGITVSDGAVIGAGSIVTKNVKPYTIVAGNPAKLIRRRFDQFTIDKIIESNIYSRDINLIDLLNKTPGLPAKKFLDLIDKEISS
jgi:virginiamycin A acetyltransferase